MLTSFSPLHFQFSLAKLTLRIQIYKRDNEYNELQRQQR